MCRSPSESTTWGPVIGAVGFERPAIIGTQDGFLVAALLAATAPQRVGSAPPHRDPPERCRTRGSGLDVLKRFFQGSRR